MSGAAHASLVFLDQYGLRGSNFYWRKYAAHGLSKADILAAGLTGDRVLVAEELIAPLQRVDSELHTHGWALYVKEGFRSRDLYKIVYERRVSKYGQVETDRVFNMTDMPHSTGYSVDVSIWNVDEDREIILRRFSDGTSALFVDFYRDRKNREEAEFQSRQKLLIDIMIRNGFRLGKRREYFHFDYKPDAQLVRSTSGL